MAVKKLSIALDKSVAEGAAKAAEHHGISLSEWINVVVERALRLEAGLAAVREWESESGELTVEELAWADDVLGMAGNRRTV